MSNPLADKYLERAQELEAYAQHIERHPPSLRLSPRWRNSKFLRREAAWWRAHAEAFVKPTGSRNG